MNDSDLWLKWRLIATLLCAFFGAAKRGMSDRDFRDVPALFHFSNFFLWTFLLPLFTKVMESQGMNLCC